MYGEELQKALQLRIFFASPWISFPQWQIQRGREGGGGFDYIRLVFSKESIYRRNILILKIFFLRKDASLSFWIGEVWKQYVFPFGSC